jgi:NADP-dependent 3-hydroxy acid dehydrogenase YdfG
MLSTVKRYISKRCSSIVMQEAGLKGGVALITGASDGMGRATSFYLSGLGVDVVLAARRLSIVQGLEEEIRQRFGVDPLAVKVDVTVDGEVEEAVAAAVKKYERIDFVANFAGNPIGYVRGDRKKPIQDQSVEHMKEIAEVDHFGSVRVLKYVLPHMIREGAGKIILISAITAVYGYSEDIDYIPYKKANEALALSTALRSEREKWGVELYTLAPGDVFNPSTWNSYSEGERIDAVGYGVIESETVAKIVSWLFSGRLKERYEMKVEMETGQIIDEGRYVPLKNGDVIVVDAKTVPRLFESVGERYRAFIPEGYKVPK